MHSESRNESNELLSERLLAFIEAEDLLASDSDPERALMEDFRRIIQVAAANLEGLGEQWAERLHRLVTEDPGDYKRWVDDWYSRDAVERVPRIVTRLLQLSPVLVRTNPNKEVNAYLREATRCFLYGFHAASVALSRAALEHALNDRIKEKLQTEPKWHMKDKVNQAFDGGLLSDEIKEMALRVKANGDQVLHKKSVSDSNALDTLSWCRGVLQHLYEQ